VNVKSSKISTADVLDKKKGSRASANCPQKSDGQTPKTKAKTRRHRHRRVANMTIM
jgi:hypothetical protein